MTDLVRTGASPQGAPAVPPLMGLPAGLPTSLPAGAPAQPFRRPTFSMIVNAALAVLIIMICADAMAVAFVLAMLDFAGAGRSAILWSEGMLLLLSLIPAAWLFRRALRAERRLADGSYGDG